MTSVNPSNSYSRKSKEERGQKKNERSEWRIRIRRVSTKHQNHNQNHHQNHIVARRQKKNKRFPRVVTNSFNDLPSYIADDRTVAPTPTNAPILARFDKACAATCAGVAIFFYFIYLLLVVFSFFFYGSTNFFFFFFFVNIFRVSTESIRLE